MRFRLPFKKSWLAWVGLFVIAYLLFLVTQLPAATAYQWGRQYTPALGAIRFQGLAGSLWSGRASQLRVNGFSFNNVSWQLHFWPLLWGDLSLAVRQRDNDSFTQGDIVTGLSNGVLQLDTVKGSLPAARLMPLFYGFPIAITGQFAADIKEGVIRKGQQLSLSGEVTWREAALTAPQPISFGDLSVKLQASDTGTVLSVQDKGGPLQLQGQIKLQGNGQYQTNLQLAARGNADPALRQSLVVLGRADAQGRVQINRQGKLPNW